MDRVQIWVWGNIKTKVTYGKQMFRIQGLDVAFLGFRDQGFGFKAKVSGSVEGFGFYFLGRVRLRDLGFQVYDLGLDFQCFKAFKLLRAQRQCSRVGAEG